MRVLSVCALCAALGAPAANAAVLTHTFDIGGLASEGSYLANFSTLTHSFGVSGTVISVAFDINATMTAPSWSEELQIAIDTNLDSSVDGNLNMSLFGGVNNSSPFAAAGSIAANSLSSDGDVFLTLYESFDDATPNPDAVYGLRSSVTVEFETAAVAVPVPASLALLGAGLLALMAVVRPRMT